MNAKMAMTIELEVMCHMHPSTKKFRVISKIESKYLPVYDGVSFTRASSPSAASSIDLSIKNSAAKKK
jgi:hypothetical protein